MSFFQVGKKNSRSLWMMVVWAIFLLSGCVAGKTENANVQPSSLPGKETPSQKQIQSIGIQKQDKNLEIRIQGNQKLSFTSLKQPFPFAICVYLPETSFDPGLVVEQIKDEDIGGLKLTYADQNQTLAKLEILLNREIPYEVQEEGDLLRVILSQGLAAEKGSDPITIKEIGSETAKEKVLPEAMAAKSLPNAGPAISKGLPGKAAVMTHIEFNTQPSGRSDIRIETSSPVRYDIIGRGDRILNLNLYNTKIPDHHQRPLLTQYFNAAVERIEPVISQEKPKDSIIRIHIREKVPFQVVQNENTLSLVFEPSQMEPPPFNKAKKDLSTPIEKTTIGSADVSAGMGKGKMNSSQQESKLTGEALPQYTGEKIKLDFYETDIKNVFRILRSVSGLNFAIDKDVQGKVTMTLEDPVPWDQVLDLVLKMNSLGKKKEGNVIRIATLESLKNEEQTLQDALAAKKKSMEQKQSFEPLITEYIPINYSDAQEDIKPHIEKILTKDRGTLSVDQRTNMIIITDTQVKIDQAQEIIFRLDTVTPQIMIEAKVVEVTKEFSRSIGVGWNLSNAAAVTSSFVDDFNVSVNKPSGSGANMDFAFFRLFGSSVAALNAKLEASEELGDVKIVSSPRILTLDNKKAKIKQGVEFAYLERDDAGGSSVKFKNIDLLLEVTPHVTPDKRISMTLFLTKNDIAAVTSTGVPTLATNEAQTELLVNDNDTVVIGGVVKTTKTNKRDGLPFLSGIPIFGALFRTDTEGDDRNELLIFLTPSIVQLEQKRHAKISED